MSLDYQSLIIVGNATKDAAHKTSEKGGVEYTAFSLGVSDAKDRTTFFQVVVFGNLGVKLAKYITKGKQVLVEGQIRIRDRGGFSVVADKVRLGAQGGSAQ